MIIADSEVTTRLSLDVSRTLDIFEAPGRSVPSVDPNHAQACKLETEIFGG